MDINENRFKHLTALREDIRDEIKKRIKQRDIYSIELTIALATILGISFSDPSFKDLILISPLVTAYFTALIFYSYHIHLKLSKYLREKIEPGFGELLGLPKGIEIETFSKAEGMVGIRKYYFLGILFVILILISIIYHPCISFDYSPIRDKIISAICFGFAVIVGIFTIWYYYNTKNKENNSKEEIVKEKDKN